MAVAWFKSRGMHGHRGSVLFLLLYRCSSVAPVHEHTLRYHCALDEHFIVIRRDSSVSTKFSFFIFFLDTVWASLNPAIYENRCAPHVFPSIFLYLRASATGTFRILVLGMHIGLLWQRACWCSHAIGTHLGDASSHRHTRLLCLGPFQMQLCIQYHRLVQS